jgi:hypothetical protein
MSRISAFCRITDTTFSLDGDVVFERSPVNEATWAKQLYNYLGLDYSKFYKMDRLAQFGFLATEGVKKVNAGISAYNDDEIALLFANSESSADTDDRFEKSYNTDGMPSPSLFVYTLPNIVLGELAIRNKWYGENMFFVFPKFNPTFFKGYTNVLINKGARAVLNGWVSLAEDKVDVLLFLIEKGEEGEMITEEQLFELYTDNDTK